MKMKQNNYCKTFGIYLTMTIGMLILMQFKYIISVPKHYPNWDSIGNSSSINDCHMFINCHGNFSIYRTEIAIKPDSLGIRNWNNTCLLNKENLLLKNSVQVTCP